MTSNDEHTRSLGSCLVYDLAHLLDARGHSRKGIKRAVGSIGNNLCKRRLAHAGRAPQYKRGHIAGLNHAAYYAAGTDKVFLSDVFVEISGPQTLGQGCVGHLVMLNFEF